VALWPRFERENARRAGGKAAGTSVGRRRDSVEKRGPVLASCSHPARRTALPRVIRAAIPIVADTDERGEEPNPVPLMRGCFQAARGREADESTSQVQRIIVRKNQAKSLRL
jgi:hypothetical protein